MDTTSLKHCAFCGKHDLVIVYGNVHCNVCRIDVPLAIWNQRDFPTELKYKIMDITRAFPNTGVMHELYDIAEKL